MMVPIVRAQEVSELHQIRQTPDGHKQMVTFFNQLGVTADYLYVVFYPPMNCPRCEGAIKPFIHEVDQLDSLAQTAVIAFYPKQEAAVKLLEKQGFGADFNLVDTEYKLLESFYISSETLQVPFLLKFNARTGHLISSVATLGINYNTALVNEMVERKISLPKFHKERNANAHAAMKVTKLPKSIADLLIKPKATYLIQEPDSMALGVISAPGITNDFKQLAFVEDLTFDVYLSEQKDGKYVVKQIFKPSLEEEMLFKHKDVSDSIFYLLKNYGVLHSMFFNPSIVDNHLLVNASLPNLFWEDRENEEIGYKNKASFLFKDIENGNLVNHYQIKDKYAKGDLIFNHTSAVFDKQQTQFLVPIEKGWPVIGTTSSPDTVSHLNLNKSAFYKNAPMLSIFDTTGTLIRVLGKLPELYQKLHLGYSLFNPRVKANENAIWIGDGYSGQLTKFERENYQGKIVFAGFGYADSLFKPNQEIEALGDLIGIKSKFTKKLVDFYVSDNEILLLIEEGEFLYLTKLEGAKESEMRNYLITNYNGLKLSSFQFVESQNKPTICALGENPDEAHLVVFDIPD